MVVAALQVQDMDIGLFTSLFHRMQLIACELKIDLANDRVPDIDASYVVEFVELVKNKRNGR